MTSPPKDITVICPKCLEEYVDWTRASVNFDLDDFDDEYMEQVCTATCKLCGHKADLEDDLDYDYDADMFYPKNTPAPSSEAYREQKWERELRRRREKKDMD